jgi:flagellar assembly protein FliH
MSDRADTSGAAAVAAQRWSLPSVEGPIVSRRVEPGAADPDIYDRAGTAGSHKRGYDAGVAAGRAEMQVRINELQAQVARLQGIFSYMARPLEELDAEVEKQLTLLALTVGKQILRRELKMDPAQIIAIIRESVARLPAAAREVRVHLHPEDATIVRGHLSPPTGERAWSVVDDPTLTQGGCLVRTDTSQIDARLESRLNAIVSAALGEERSAERGAT